MTSSLTKLAVSAAGIGGGGWGMGVAEGGSREAAFCDFDFKSIEG